MLRHIRKSGHTNKQITYPATMDFHASLRPRKRRRTKRGRPLHEDDSDAADGIAIRSVMVETESGPVEEISAVPVWVDQPEPMEPTSTPDARQPSLPDQLPDLFQMEDPLPMEDEPGGARPSKVTSV